MPLFPPEQRLSIIQSAETKKYISQLIHMPPHLGVCRRGHTLRRAPWTQHKRNIHHQSFLNCKRAKQRHHFGSIGLWGHARPRDLRSARGARRHHVAPAGRQELSKGKYPLCTCTNALSLCSCVCLDGMRDDCLPYHTANMIVIRL